MIGLISSCLWGRIWGWIGLVGGTYYYCTWVTAGSRALRAIIVCKKLEFYSPHWIATLLFVFSENHVELPVVNDVDLPPEYVVRVIMVYGRSQSTIPSFSGDGKQVCTTTIFIMVYTTFVVINFVIIIIYYWKLIYFHSLFFPTDFWHANGITIFLFWCPLCSWTSWWGK